MTKPYALDDEGSIAAEPYTFPADPEPGTDTDAETAPAAPDPEAIAARIRRGY